MANEKKYGSGGRKQFVRTRVPIAESISGAVILVLLVVIGFAIYYEGKHFDPNLYAVRRAPEFSLKRGMRAMNECRPCRMPCRVSMEFGGTPV